jgi:hypothetical protein
MEPIAFEDRIRGAIDAHCEDNPDSLLSELIGALELVKAELIAAALEPDEE